MARTMEKGDKDSVVTILKMTGRIHWFRTRILYLVKKRKHHLHRLHLLMFRKSAFRIRIEEIYINEINLFFDSESKDKVEKGLARTYSGSGDFEQLVTAAPATCSRTLPFPCYTR